MEIKKEKKKKRKGLRIYNPKKIYILTIGIISDWDDGNGAGPRSEVVQKYLAVKKRGKFYELFSKVEIGYEHKISSRCTVSFFNHPEIKEVEELKDYMKDDASIWLTKKQLFYFITRENAKLRLMK